MRKEFIPPTYRELYAGIKKDIQRRQIQVVAGLRRTGKSTLFFQIIDSLITSSVNPFHIIYCSFDEPELQEKTIEELLKEYTSITQEDYTKEKIYLFLDEAQKSKNWVSSVKLLYDHFRNIKIFISGSASLHILSEARKSLAGRAVYYELRPLSFPEFLHLKGITTKNFLLHKDMLHREFNNFLFRPFPELVHEKDMDFIKAYIRNSVIEPVILKDIPKEFRDVDVLLLERLATLFFTNPGQYLSIDELAKELGRAKTTLYQAIFYLEFSFLIKRVFNFRPSMRAASRKLSKVYPYHPCLCLPFHVQQDKYAESMVFFELNTPYYWREKEKEIDFLKDSLPVEVKYKNDIKKADLKWIHYFLKKYGGKLGIAKAYVITKEHDERRGNIRLVSLARFCFDGL